MFPAKALQLTGLITIKKWDRVSIFSPWKRKQNTRCKILLVG